MIRTTPNIARRRGVTLVEMLVATAMCIAGMWMLTWMFQQATASFSLANAQATLTGHERLVTTILTRDLDQDRFPEDDTAFNGGRRLSDLKGLPPRRGGYFIASSKAATAQTGANLLEGPPPVGTSPGFTDLYGFGSARYTDHFIQFTTILKDTPGNRYYAEVQVLDPATPPTLGLRTTAGVAAEISYYLRDTGTRTPNGVPLYDLMRVQWIVAQNDFDKTDYLRDIVTPGYRAFPPTYPNGVDTPHEVMACARANPATGQPDEMFTLARLGLTAVWTNAPRFTPGGVRTTGRRVGEDRLMANVVSFEVKFTGDPVNFGPVTPMNPSAWPTQQPGSLQTPPSPNMWPRPLLYDPNNPEHPAGYQGNSDYPFDNLPDDGRFDTSDRDGTQASTTNPQRATRRVSGRSGEPLYIRGVQIRIRVPQREHDPADDADHRPVNRTTETRNRHSHRPETESCSGRSHARTADRTAAERVSF